MGIPVLIIGESGSGKSCSLRNFKKGEIGIFSVAGKRLPFKSDLPVCNNASYAHIYKGFENKVKSFAIDDSQYLLAFEIFDRAKETGYGKFTDIAVNFRNLIHYVNTTLPDDVIVYFLHHSELSENGKLKAKTSGKMLDNQLTVEGLFTTVLYCMANEDKHYFLTQSSGFTTAKSPMGMLDKEIDNDLKFVDEKIREYYEIKGEKNVKE